MSSNEERPKRDRAPKKHFEDVHEATIVQQNLNASKKGKSDQKRLKRASGAKPRQASKSRAVADENTHGNSKNSQATPRTRKKQRSAADVEEAAAIEEQRQRKLATTREANRVRQRRFRARKKAAAIEEANNAQSIADLRQEGGIEATPAPAPASPSEEGGRSATAEEIQAMADEMVKVFVALGSPETRAEVLRYIIINRHEMVQNSTVLAILDEYASLMRDE